jgi:ParB family transcriptional regulator, chromosome partitioning protein
MPPKRVSLRDRTTQDASASPPPSSLTPSSPSPTVESPLWGAERGEQSVVELELREIMPNRRQPRANPAEANLDELAESIRTHGVIQPVIVRPIPLTKYEGAGRRYELIAGERRWRASTLAGQTTIPALIRVEETDHRGMLELALIENVQRQDLHPLDEAAAFGQLSGELGYSYSEIAARIGKSKAYVTNRMRLLQLDDDLRALVAARPDTIKHVYELARISDPDLRAPLVAAVRDEDLSRAATSARVDVVLGIGRELSAVSQETDGDKTHEVVSSQESVSQETERDRFHDDAPADEEDKLSRDALRLTRDLEVIGRMLDRWEKQTARSQGDSRDALLRIIEELSTRMERIARNLLNEADIAPETGLDNDGTGAPTASLVRRP